MTVYSESDLATETLRAAALIGIDEVPSGAELIDTQQSNRSVIATMAAIGLPIWNGSEIEVPDEYFEELAFRLSMPLRLKNGMISELAYYQLIDASEQRLTVMAAPSGRSPNTLATNESTGPNWWPRNLLTNG